MDGTPEIDMAKLNEFIGKAVTDLGATFNAGLVVIGDKLGLYKAMAGARSSCLRSKRSLSPILMDRCSFPGRCNSRWPRSKRESGGRRKRRSTWCSKRGRKVQRLTPA